MTTRNHADDGDPPEVALILKLVAEDFGFEVAEIIGRRRYRPLVRARHTAALVLREALALSYPQIGWALGGRDHSTAHHAVQKARGRALDASHYRDRVARLVALALSSWSTPRAEA